jgi:hypothetical protein
LNPLWLPTGAAEWVVKKIELSEHWALAWDVVFFTLILGC